MALYSGATLVIPKPRERYVGTTLQNFINAHHVTSVLLTPSVLATLNATQLPMLRCVVSGGEPCAPALIKQWANKVDFYNAYGPTESTVCVLIEKMNLQSKPNYIGQPLGSANLSIFSDSMQPLPPGAVGELWISGQTLAKEYINNFKLISEKFVVYNDKRYYRTGDYVRYLSQHGFEYIGRIDQQIKIRGIRIELSEISHILENHATVQQAICLISENNIIAYLKCYSNFNLHDLKMAVSIKLPEFMRPNLYIMINEVPIKESGKIDYSKLPVPSRQSSIIKKPHHQLEQTLQSLWIKYLSISSLSVDDDFFSAGGNSLQAMQIAADISAQFNIEYTTPMFYESASIENQAKQIISLLKIKMEDDNYAV